MRRCVQCPNCGKKGMLPDGYASDRVRCPGCFESFAIDGPAGDAPAEVEGADDAGQPEGTEATGRDGPSGRLIAAVAVPTGLCLILGVVVVALLLRSPEGPQAEAPGIAARQQGGTEDMSDQPRISEVPEPTFRSRDDPAPLADRSGEGRASVAERTMDAAAGGPNPLIGAEPADPAAPDRVTTGAASEPDAGPLPEGEAIIDVRSHGAVGDGIADDKAAIEAAIAAAPAGATVYFPPGTYRVAFSGARPGVTDRIALAKDIRIAGAGPDATTIAFPPEVPTFDWYGFHVEPDYDVEIADVTIRGQQGNTLGVDRRGLPDGIPIYRDAPRDGGDYDAELRLRRVTLDNDGNRGVFSAAGSTSNAWTGRIGLDVEDSVIEGWVVGLSAFSGYAGDDALPYLHVRRSTIRANGHNHNGNGYATYIHPNVSVDFDRVTFGKATSGYGFRMYGEAPVGSPRYVRIRNSDFTPDLGGVAILLGDPRGVTAEIEGCTFRNAGHAIQARHSAVVRDSVFRQGGDALNAYGAYVSAAEAREIVVTIDGSSIENGDVVNPFGREGSTLLLRDSVLRGDAEVVSRGGRLEVVGCRDEADGAGLIVIVGGRALIEGNEFRGDHRSVIRIGNQPDGARPDRVEVRDNSFIGPESSRYSRNVVFHFKVQHDEPRLPDGVLTGGGNTLRASGYSHLSWDQSGGPLEGVPASLWAP